MLNPFDKRHLAAAAFILIALVLLATQGNLSFIFLFPILLLTLVTSWYLYKEIQRDNEENLKRGIRYMQEEAEAQRWLHRSFVPKMRTLAKRELASIIIACGVVLLSFIFLWSFFVSGLISALLNTLLGLLFFVGFIIYTLYAPKEFTKITRHVPTRYRHHSKNDWVHAYLLLLPFAVIGYFLYSLTTTGEGIERILFETIAFFFSYTFLFICIYSLWFLYNEYQNEQQKITEKTARKIMKEQ